ncbi:MAG: M13 family metallopeptidase [Bacteroidales bacterium]
MKTQIKFLFFTIMTTALLFSACKNDNKKDLDISYINENVDPGDNFYEFANEGWEKAHPLPSDESRFGSFDLLDKETKKKVRNILEECANGEFDKNSNEHKIGTLYSLGMNTEKINKQGTEPILPDIRKINNLKNIEDVQKQITHFHKYSIGSTFSFYASADAKDSEMMIAQLSQGGLGMSDRDYYTKDDERTKEIRKNYREYIANIFELADYNKEEAKNASDKIMELETRLAKASMTRLEMRNPHNTYHKFQLDEIKQKFPDFDWENYFNELNIEAPKEINVRQPDFFAEANTMLKETPVEDWKIYLTWNLLNSSAPYLTDNFVQAHFDFYGKIMQGTEEMRERWRRVLDVTNSSLGDAIGQKFVEEHFPPEAKEKMEVLVENLRKAFEQRIEKLEWMGGETKKKALAKLEVMNTKIGFPEKWKDYSDLETDESSYIANVRASNKFNKQYQLNKIGKPVDKDEWFFPPQTVNAYYAPSLNEICFPAGILQPPFFYLDGDDAVNYGAIGAVIGHEMTHGFDDQGRQYDKEGNLNDWWTKEDSEKFEKRTQILVEQYNEKTVLDTVKADGELTLGENIADLGGLSIAHTAFKNATSNKELPEKINGYTPEQRFFLAWARVWAQNIREKEMLRRTKEDVHSLGIHRVNGPVINMENWYNAFSVDEDNELYLPEDKRAKIW